MVDTLRPNWFGSFPHPESEVAARAFTIACQKAGSWCITKHQFVREQDSQFFVTSGLDEFGWIIDDGRSLTASHRFICHVYGTFPLILATEETETRVQFQQAIGWLMGLRPFFNNRRMDAEAELDNGEVCAIGAYDRINHSSRNIDQIDALICALSAIANTESKPVPNLVHQTRPTNCFEACVAMVLGVPIDVVPSACDGATWDWAAFQHWLAGRGLQEIEVTFGSGGTIYPVCSPVPCIITGDSPRECTTGKYAVVGQLLGLEGFRMLHDPHPSVRWIDGEPTHATFFVHLNPQG